MATDNTSQSNPTIDDDMYPEMDLYLNEEESDVVFIIDGQRVPAHRLVLRLKSKVFRAMFSGHFKESTDNEILITDTTIDAFKTMLRYLYTDELVFSDGSDLELIGDVLANADKYHLKRLTNACEQHMKTVVTVGNTTVMYGLAVKYGLNDLITTLKTFITSNLSQFLSKTAEELIELNVITDNWWFKVTCNGLLKAYNYFEPRLPRANNVPGYFSLNGIGYDKDSSYSIHNYRKDFDFNDLYID